MTPPPTTNPIRWAAQKRRHWRNPTHLKNGIWLVEEGSGPRASVRRLALVKEVKHGWVYCGWCEVYPSGVRANLKAWLGNWHWDVSGPADKTVPMLTQLVEEHG